MEMNVYGTISMLERGIRERIAEFLKEYGIDPEICRCLEYIGENGGCTASVVARELGQDRASVNRKLAKLGERGYICKRPGRRDSRSNTLYTTAAGKTILEGVRDIIGQWSQDIYASIGEDVFLKLSEAANRKDLSLALH